MSEIINNWLARISLAKFKQADNQLERGRLVGTGFVTHFPWLVTCNHVVTSCIKGKTSIDTIAAGKVETIVVDFPLHPQLSEKRFLVDLKASLPKLKQPSLHDVFDIAVLNLMPIEKLDEEIIEGWSSSWKYEVNNEFYTGHSVACKGFHVEKGSRLEGESKSVCTDGLIELDLKIDETIGGASGAPVWSDDEQSIIGMLVSQRGEKAENFRYEKVYMTPMYKVMDACDEHKQALLKYKAHYDGFKQVDDDAFWDDIRDDLEDLLSLLPSSLIKRWAKKQGWQVDQLTGDIQPIIDACRHNSGDLLRNFTTTISRELKLLERSEKYKQAKELLDDAKKLVSMLSLYSLQEQSIQSLRNGVKYTSGTLNINISHDLLGCAELVSSARMQAIPNYRKREHMVQGRYAVSHFDLEVGFKDGWVDEIGKKVWNIFFEGRSLEDYSRDYLRNYIKRELVADDPEKKNCYLVISVNPRDKNESPLLEKKNRKKFTEAFPELPIVVLDKAVESGVYISSDHALMIEIHNFYDKVDQYDETIATETQRNITG